MKDKPRFNVPCLLQVVVKISNLFISIVVVVVAFCLFWRGVLRIERFDITFT